MTEFLHPRQYRADGSAYGRPAQQPKALWVEVGPGKPMGELLRRYWHPIALSVAIGKPLHAAIFSALKASHD